MWHADVTISYWVRMQKVVHPHCLLLHWSCNNASWVLYKRFCSQNGITQRSKLLTLLLDFQSRIADSLLHKKTLFVEGLELIVQLWWNADDLQIMLEQLLKSDLTMLVIFLSSTKNNIDAKGEKLATVAYCA